MRLAPLRSSLLALAAALLCAAPAAHAYNEAVHHFLTRKAFAGRDAWLAAPLAAPTAQDHAAFRARFWQLASQSADPSLGADFLARFPTVESLDAAAFKEWLMLDPAARVHGLEPTPEDVSEPLGTLLPLASRWPDDDERNRHRYQRDAKGAVLKAPDGQPLPFDPATLWMGSLTGTSSQGHAHYGLLPPPLSDDPEVLKKDPRHFAIPANIQTFGVEFAQLYTDLAQVARHSGLPAGPWLEQAFAGASFHHLEDVANQIHTIQVGIFEFFEAAFLQSKLRDVKTLGGLLGDRATLETLGLRLVSNHHLLLEDLFAKRVAEAEGKPGPRPLPPEVTQAIAGLDHDDPELAQAARAAMAAARGQGANGDGEVAALMRALIERSSLEGPEIYRLIWTLSTPTLHDGRGHEYKDGADDPDKFVEFDHPHAAGTLTKFYRLQGQGLHRATTSLRLWQEAYDAEAARDGSDQRAVDRTLRVITAYHREAAARRAGYVPKPLAAAMPVAWAYPAGALVLLGLGALLLRRLLRR
jgi:hypothetical protein